MTALRCVGVAVEGGAANGPECTCPEPEPHTGPGIPVRLPGRSHQRGCPVVAPIFDAMDSQARDMAERHARVGGILLTPAEREVRQLRHEVAELRRMVTEPQEGEA